MQGIFNFSEIEGSEIIIQKTWGDFRQLLSNKVFRYDDIEAALQATFLRVFDDLFQHGHRFFAKRVGDVLSPTVSITRAARIEGSDPTPTYERFIPKAEFIASDNRFSPPGIEWLYLAFAPAEANFPFSVDETCALKECRAAAGEHFALCEFKSADKYQNHLLIDLTIAKETEFNDINSALEEAGQKITKREIKEGIRVGTKTGRIPKVQVEDIKPALEKWAVFTYAKLLAEQIFVPISTEDRELMYAPFQCMAQYFLSKGYIGIIYSSTVFPAGKNIVLFDKHAAVPYGSIKTVNIPAEF
ncbi:MAG: RES family NAD+ phosphorylase [Eubacteriales bacterium]|nr:RES family NAD+ phosphorylase [Eubacteriales bacterium]